MGEAMDKVDNVLFRSPGPAKANKFRAALVAALAAQKAALRWKRKAAVGIGKFGIAGKKKSTAVTAAAEDSSGEKPPGLAAGRGGRSETGTVSLSGSEPNRTEQNRTEQNRTEQKTERTEQNRTEQNRTEPNRTDQNRTEQNRTEQNLYCLCKKHRNLPFDCIQV